MNLIIYPNPLLKQVSIDVTSEEIPSLLAKVPEMTQIMKKFKGVGLAAVQVGILKRFAILDMTKDAFKAPETPDTLVIINPKIVNSESTVRVSEGCLSLPFLEEIKERPSTIEVSYKNDKFEDVTSTFTGVIAQCIVHELEHMDGELLIDKLSVMRRHMYEKKLRKKGLL